MAKPSTEPTWGGLRPLAPSTPISPPESPDPPSTPPLSRVRALPSDAGEYRVLDFDIETVAAGFADPNWVPQKITCVAWKWIGSRRVESRICDVEGLYREPERRREMVAELLSLIDSADVVTGHNIIRFDLPVINAECMRLGLPVIREVATQDTMKLPKSKGFKKGLDNLGHLYKIRNQKLPLDWQQWEDAYAEEGWPIIRERCESDVLGHEEVRAAQIERGLHKAPKVWRSG